MHTIISGTPTSTTSPSGTDVLSISAATTITATRPPDSRAQMSKLLPSASTSVVPMASTSPLAISRGRSAPTFTEWREVTWIVMYAAESQFVIALRCRIPPASAVNSASTITSPAQSSSPELE